MKKLAIISAAIAALAIGGCAQVSQFEDFVTSPKTAATVAVLSQTAVVVICDISAIAAVASTVETAAQVDASVIGTTGKVYAASNAACVGLGGLVAKSAVAPVGAVVVQ